MPMSIHTFRRLVALDPNDALSRYGLGSMLFKESTNRSELEEAAEHLTHANQKDPNHLATYHVLGQVLIRLERRDEARTVLTEGIRRAKAVGEGMGRDLVPAMEALLASLA